MTTWNRVAGDVDDTIDAVLNGVTDLTAATAVEGHVWHGRETPVTLTGSVVSASERRVRINLGSWLALASARSYSFEIQVSFGTTVITWPEDKPDEIRVRSQGA